MSSIVEVADIREMICGTYQASTGNDYHEIDEIKGCSESPQSHDESLQMPIAIELRPVDTGVVDGIGVDRPFSFNVSPNVKQPAQYSSWLEIVLCKEDMESSIGNSRHRDMNATTFAGPYLHPSQQDHYNTTVYTRPFQDQNVAQGPVAIENRKC